MQLNKPKSSGTRRQRVQFLIALVVTAVLLTYIGLTTNVDQAMDALLRADFGMIILVACLAPWILLTVDGIGLRFLVRRAGYEVTLPTMVKARGASMLAGIVSYAFSLGMITAVVARGTKKPWVSVAGVFVLIALVDISTMCALVALAILAQATELPANVESALLWGAAIGSVWLPITWLVLRRGWLPQRVLAWLDRHEVTEAFRRLAVIDLVIMAVLRLIVRFIGAVEYYFYAIAFQFIATFSTVVVFDLATMLVTNLPFTIAELGSTHVMMRWLWVPFAPAGLEPIPAVDAFSTASVVIYTGQKIIIGLALLPWFMRTVSKKKAT